MTIDDPHDSRELARRFHAEHERLYAHSLPSPSSSGGAARDRARHLHRPAATRLAGGGLEPPAARAGARGRSTSKRPALGGLRDLRRAGLLAGNRLAGPAIVEQMDTTTVLFPARPPTARDRHLIIRSAHG